MEFSSDHHSREPTAVITEKKNQNKDDKYCYVYYILIHDPYTDILATKTAETMLLNSCKL
jgi:hypothetical protein